MVVVLNLVLEYYYSCTGTLEQTAASRDPAASTAASENPAASTRLYFNTQYSVDKLTMLCIMVICMVNLPKKQYSRM
jgi:hypothetical protein